MTHSTPAVSHEQVLLPNQSFFSWLRTQTTLFISQILALLTFISFIASLIYYVHDVADVGEHAAVFRLATINLFIDFAHIILIVIFIIALIQVLDDNVRGSYRVRLVYGRVFGGSLDDWQHKAVLEQSKQRLRRFKTYFLCFWCVMLALYTAFAFKHSLTIPKEAAPAHAASQQDQPTVPTHAEESKENHSSSAAENEEPKGKTAEAAAAHAASEQDQPTVPADAEQSKENHSSSAAPNEEHLSWLKDKAFPFLTFSLNNLSLTFVFWCFAVLMVPTHNGKHRKQPRMSGRVTTLAVKIRDFHRQYFWSNKSRRPYLFFTLVIGLFTAAYLPLFAIHDSSTLKTFQAAFDALSGVVNALVLALLIARLDSKLIGLPSWLIFVLYCYSAVQPLFVAFEQQSEVFRSIETAVLIVVFISKIYFFLIIFYTLQTGRMLNYLYCFPFLSQRVNAAQKQALIENGNSSGSKSGLVPAWLKPSRISRRIVVVGSLLLFVLFGFLKIFVPGFGGVLVYIDAVNLWTVGVMIILLVGMGNDTRMSRESLQEMYKTLFQKSLLDPEMLIKKSADQVRKFKRYFVLFWCFMWLLYVAVALRHAGIWHSQLNLDKQLSAGEVVQVVAPSFLEFALSTINLMCIFWCFVVLYLPAHDDKADKKQKLVIRYSRFVVALLLAAFLLLLCSVGPDRMTPGNLDIHRTVFNGISGTLSAIVLALLIARLDSKIISLSSWLIGVLFCYSAVQPLSVVFDVEMFQGIETVTFIVALIFKICFFLIMVYALQAERVLHYLVCYPLLDKRVDSIFENQFEIRTSKNESHLFTFSIWKRNKLVYSTDAMFHSKSDCDRRVEALRKVMEEEQHYHPGSSCGTVWVGVTDIEKNLLCESTSLRSEEDALDLIQESIDKIPYCKYDRG